MSYVGETVQQESILSINCRGRSRTAATYKVELFVKIVNGWKPLTISQRAPPWMLQHCSSPRSATELRHYFRITLGSTIILGSTRDAFLAAKISKEGFWKVFNVWTKFHFSNFEVGRRTFPWSWKCLLRVLK